MHREPGRNDPCLCGSGRKYKNCCGSPANTTQPITPPNNVIEGVMKYALTGEWGEISRRAYETFTAIQPALSEEQENRLFGEGSDLAQIQQSQFFDWLLSDYVHDATGRNVIDEYLKRRGWNESAAGRTWLQALRASPLSLYEVQSVRPRVDVTVRDVLRDSPPFTVIERMGSTQMKPWDYLVARVLPYHGHPYFSGAILPLSRDAGAALKQRLVTRLRECIANPSPRDWDDFLRGCGVLLWNEYVSLYINPRLPALRNAEGDAMVFVKQKFTFDPARRAAMQDRISRHAEFERESDEAPGDFTWFEPVVDSPDQHRLLGRLHFDHDHGVLETNSRERHERGSALLRAAFGDSVTWRPEVIEDPWQAARNAPQPDKNAADEIPADVKRKLILQALDDHYRKWPDTPLPALGGKTAREAVKTAPGRAHVVELLKTLENMEARKPESERYDTRWLWSELGVEGLAQDTSGEVNRVDELDDPADDEAFDDDFDDEDEAEDLEQATAALKEIVAVQMQQNDPPATREAYRRLRSLGYPHDEAMHSITTVLALTLGELFQQDDGSADIPFDLDTYTHRLNALPALPTELS